MSDRQQVQRLKELAYQMRRKLVLLCGSYEGSVHIGGDLSMTDVMVALFNHTLNLSPDRIQDPERDRFVLGKGHGAVGMYIAMELRGFFDFDQIVKTYGKMDSAFGMHPCKLRLPALECSGGSLGQGLAICVGMALSAKQKKQKHRVFCMLGDGETCEGEVWESIMSARAFGLGNLIALVDRNRQMMTSYTEDSIMLEPYPDKWKAFGWNVVEIDGNDMEQIVNALDALPDGSGTVPTVVICNTIKGKGISFMEKQIDWHLGHLNAEVAQAALKELDMNHNTLGGAK